MRIDSRLRIVQYAAAHGVKPAARHFGCQPKTIRKWLGRWNDAKHSRTSLEDQSRAPHSCPHKTSPALAAQVIAARIEAPRFSARRLKAYFHLAPSIGAIARILRQEGLTKPRKTKAHKKRDMRELKARYKALQELQVDTKDLTDIAPYAEQALYQPERNLPRFEYTLRDVKTGAVFLGFANERSEALACCFIRAVAAHFQRAGFNLRGFATIQTDNGSEFSGQENKRRHDRGFRHMVEDPQMIGATHRFIPVGRKNYQADVESFHDRIEAEFLELETFADRQEFFRKPSSWQLWWNTTRTNSYKNNRSPDQILLAEHPKRDWRLWLLPALDLDALMAYRADLSFYLDKPQGGGTTDLFFPPPAIPARVLAEICLSGNAARS